MTTIYVNASRASVLKAIRRLPALAAGKGDSGKWNRVLLVRLGMELLGHIRTAFEAKARGGTDESGLRWKPLAKSTIAYSRRHRKVFVKGGGGSTAARPGWLPAGPQRAGDSPSWLLTKKQRERWWALYRQFGGKQGTGKAYHAGGGSPSWAAARAWVVLKKEGAKTLMETYGNLPAEILRDTGLLFNSLSPGVKPENAGPDPPRVDKQVCRLTRSGIIVGTNRLWAGTHHRGVPGRIPQRRLWPEVNRWPRRWWDAILKQASAGVMDIFLWQLSKL